MLTRSAARKMEMNYLEIDIDFDDASSHWKSNKKSIGNGCYKYICEKMLSWNCKCSKPVYSGTPYCCKHQLKEKLL
jgi:hypothetical protein